MGSSTQMISKDMKVSLCNFAELESVMVTQATCRRVLVAEAKQENVVALILIYRNCTPKQIPEYG